MAITVKHTKVSLIPDSGDDTLIEPSDWNDDHVLTGTVPVANGGTGASTLTGYVKGSGTANMTASATIPNTDITGLGTASTKDAGVALGVATLDAGGKVPVSELPAAVLGALSYQGTWNASTNTPTLTSSTGTKGYYYVVAVAGSTDLDGITDWLVGDWAVYNGTVWQKVDNSDAGGDVVGPASATDNAIARFDSTTGKLLQNSVVTVSDAGVIDGATTITNLDYLDFDTTYNTTLGAGQLGWNGNDTLGLGMIGGNVVQHIGEDTFFYVKASATIAKGQLCMFTGAVGSSGVLTAAPATAIPFAEAIIGVAAEDIANNGFGLIQNTGTLKGVNTSAFLDGDILYYNSAVTGGFTKVFPTSGPIVIAAAVAKSGSGGSGILTVRISFQTRVTASTGISVSQGNDVVTVTNTAPDQTVSISAGTGISTSGTYPNFTVTNTAPDQTVALSAGTGISVSGTYPNFTVTNTAPSSGGTVTSVSGTAGRVTSTGGTTPVIDLASGVATAGTTGSSTLIPVVTIDTYGRVTGITTAANPQGTVTSVTGTSPVASSGGATPAISLASGYGDTQNPYASKTANYILAAPNGSAGVPTFRAMVAADVPTLNQNTTGSAATLATGRTIGMTGDVTWTSGSFNGSANVTGTATLATVTAAKGGTGQTSYAVGDLLYASTSSALSKLADVATGNALISGGVGVAPSYGKIGLTTHISGTLAIGNGGTGQTTATAAFNALNPMTTTGDILYEASPTTAARLGIGSTGQVLTVSGGLPAWATPVPSNITTNGMWENATTISANYTIGTNNNAMSAGPITVNTGVTVTVPTGSTWTIV